MSASEHDLTLLYIRRLKPTPSDYTFMYDYCMKVQLSGLSKNKIIHYLSPRIPFNFCEKEFKTDKYLNYLNQARDEFISMVFFYEGIKCL